MMKFGALNWFDFFIKKLKKALDCINHVIYTCDMFVWLNDAYQADTKFGKAEFQGRIQECIRGGFPNYQWAKNCMIFLDFADLRHLQRMK